MKDREKIYKEIKKFLILHADDIQKQATKHHKKFVGSGGKYRSEIIEKYQENHRKIVRALAANLSEKDFKKGLRTFKSLGENLAEDSVKDGLYIEEAVNGIIFLKQALFEKVKKTGLINELSTEDFYNINQIFGTYVDIVSSKIAFKYHESYVNQSDRQKDDFLSLVSHELKTPVTSIKAYGQVLQKRFAKEHNAKYVEILAKMDNQINKLSVVIRDLLDMSKISGGELRFYNNNFHFDELVQEIVDEIRGITDSHKFIMRGKSGKIVRGDRDRIGQVLTNILTNAIKYSPRSKKIVVMTSVAGTNIKICVRDYGVGISKDKQPKVFRRFYREPGLKQETYPGLGLGMYISSEIIKKQKGTIWVESKGKGRSIPRDQAGSTFCFTIPFWADSA